jgi:uncharacterized protein (DUF433 family)
MPKPRIESNPRIMMGQPVVAGTRVTVELILDKLAAGETTQQILQAHSCLIEGDIRAALNFAAESLRADVLYPIHGPTA